MSNNKHTHTLSLSNQEEQEENKGIKKNFGRFLTTKKAAWIILPSISSPSSSSFLSLVLRWCRCWWGWWWRWWWWWSLCTYHNNNDDPPSFFFCFWFGLFFFFFAFFNSWNNHLWCQRTLCGEREAGEGRRYQQHYYYYYQKFLFLFFVLFSSACLDFLKYFTILIEKTPKKFAAIRFFLSLDDGGACDDLKMSFLKKKRIFMASLFRYTLQNWHWQKNISRRKKIISKTRIFYNHHVYQNYFFWDTKIGG